jgi:hypothetical protein
MMTKFKKRVARSPHEDSFWKAFFWKAFRLMKPGYDTAALLHSAGKSNWLMKRNETVVAKGKGELQT